MSCAEPIRQLDDAVISGIAAGEVVERPASIVKELVENALDAGARRVVLAFDDDRLDVTDDGSGIAPEQLRLALARHATSKIRALADLESIASFGFRGEALASIGGVSRVEIVSRPRDLTAGARIVAAHGVLGDSEAAAARAGTRVTVSELFANVPARRKFLKSASAEYGLASDVLKRFAMARPDVHFRLERAGKIVFEHAPVTTLKERLAQVYGRELAPGMIPVEARFKGFSLGGAVSGPGTSWGSARRVTLFVNGRWVQDRLLFRAVMEAYRTYLLKGRYPAAALFLDLGGSLVDVNVHPQKLEVRFSEPDVVMSFVVESVREALRTGAGPLGRWGLVSGIRETNVRAARSTPFFAPSAAESSSSAGPNAQARASFPREADTPTESDVPGYVPPSPAALAALESVVAEPEQHVLFSPAGEAGRDLDVVGQLFAGYILCERGDELLLIDQHAAHERVLFERLMSHLAEHRLERQPLLVPLTAHVGAEGVDAVARFRDELSDLGWDLDAFGEEDVVVRSVPAVAAGTDLEALAERLVADLVRTDAAEASGRLVERIFATVACHAAVRVGKRLDAEGARALLREIASVDFASSCPHGRPVARSIDRGRIERMFGR